MNLDEKIRESVKNIKMPIPRYSWDLLGVTVFVWEESAYNIEPLYSEPYELDGTTPLIFLQIGKVEFIFESKFLYKILYKRANGLKPLGLK